MSNFLAIATVTATLQRVLTASVGADVPGATVTAVQPTSTGTGLPGVGANVFLYQVTPNTAWRNADLPTRSPAGRVVQRPRVALDLHYLLTVYGNEVEFEPQRVLGSVARTMHARPVLARDDIEATVADPALAPHLGASDLADEVERVKFTPLALSLEELSKLWSVLLQTAYTLSAAYVGTVVLIEADDAPRRALPVRTRVIRATPFQRAAIEEVLWDNGEAAPTYADRTVPVQLGDTIRVRGRRLSGAIDRVRVGVADVQPVPDSVRPNELRVALTDPDLRAGVVGVQVVYAGGSRSNAAPLVLRPRVSVDGPNVTAAVVPIDFAHDVGRDQEVALLLNEQGAPPAREPFAYRFEAPTDNGIANPAVDSTNRIEFAIEGVEAATYVVRVEVSGAESVPDGVTATIP